MIQRDKPVKQLKRPGHRQRRGRLELPLVVVAGTNTEHSSLSTVAHAVELLCYRIMCGVEVV